MLSNPAVIVIADDFTGAAEVAGRALADGFSAAVTLRGSGAVSRPVDVQVFDTETRLLRPLDAARRLTHLGASVAAAPRPLFKKVDSVLRGPVVAELEAIASAMDRSRMLVVPANPAGGRTVVDGIYRIHGVPLSETDFAQDPHHPARSSRVTDLLNGSSTLEIRSAPVGKTPATRTITIGDASSVADLEIWARSLEPDTLAAGSAAFFSAWLARQMPAAPRIRARAQVDISTLLRAPVLLVSGTTAPAQRAVLAEPGAPVEWLSLEDIDQRNAGPWVDRVEKRLREDSRAIAAIRAPMVPESDRAASIRAALAAAALRAWRTKAASHLIVEGGATAATVLQALDWTDLDALHEWAPGVVTLRPHGQPDHWVTVKPGSYPWPADVARRLFSTTASGTTADGRR